MNLPSIEIITCDQGTPEWHAARCGCVTASKFDCVLANGRGGAPSKTRQTYLYTLAGEILTGEVVESYKNADMERGTLNEPEARAYYSLMTDNIVEEVGFLKRGQVGYSPDGLIGTDGLYETKNKLPHLHIAALLANVLPPEHKAQVQGGLWVSEREWLDFHSYWRGLPPFILRVYRDETYIAELSEGVEAFLGDLNDLVEKLRARS